MAKDLTALRQQADTIRNEKTKNANTAERIGGMFADMLDYMDENSSGGNYKGYFQNATLLNEKYPNPANGDYAWVGEPYPGNVYNVVDGKWHDTGEKAEGGLDPSEFATKEELNNKQDNISSINVNVDDSIGKPSATASISEGVMTFSFKNLKGGQGPSNVIKIGSVTVSDSTEDASASMTGESPEQILNLVLPRGPQGNSGVTGDTSNIEVVNDLNGGESTNQAIKVLSAEQGLVLNNILKKCLKDASNNSKVLDLTNYTQSGYVATTGVMVDSDTFVTLDFYDIGEWTEIIFTNYETSSTGLCFYDSNKRFLKCVLNGMSDSYSLRNITRSEIPNARYIKHSWFKSSKINPLIIIKNNSQNKLENAYNTKIIDRVNNTLSFNLTQDIFVRKGVMLTAEGKVTTQQYTNTTNPLLLPESWIRVEFDLWTTELAGMCLYDSDMNVLLYMSGDVNGNRTVISKVDYPDAKYIAFTRSVTSTESENDIMLISICSNSSYLNEQLGLIMSAYNTCYVTPILYTDNLFCVKGYYNKWMYNDSDTIESTDLIYLGNWEYLILDKLGSSMTGLNFHDHERNYFNTLFGIDTAQVIVKRKDYYKAAYIRIPRLKGVEGCLYIINRPEPDMFVQNTENGRQYNPIFDKTELLAKEVFTADITGRTYNRIPSIFVTNKGDILYATEARSQNEDKGDISICVRKEKNGVIGESVSVLTHTNNRRYMNPCFAQESDGSDIANRLYLFALVCLSDNKMVADCTTDELDIVYIYSDDEGESWSSEISIKSKWDLNLIKYIAVSPGKGICTKSGTLYLPCQAAAKDGRMFSGLLFKAINGQFTFSCITHNFNDNESVVIERQDNEIILNCRHEGGGYPFRRTQYIYNLNNNSFYEQYDYFTPYVACHTSVDKITIDGITLYIRTFPDASKSLVKDSSMSARVYNTLFVSNDFLKWIPLARISEVGGYTSVAYTNNKIIMLYESINEGKIYKVEYTDMDKLIKAIKLQELTLQDRLNFCL